MIWTKESEEAANRQGWGLATVWDSAKQRIECMIVSKTPTMTDSDVNTRVNLTAATGDNLCRMALQAVFHSKLGDTEQTRKAKANGSK